MKTDNSNVPALRFPEFSEAGEWVEEEFETFFDLNRQNVKAVKFDKQNIITVKLHCAGVVKNERNANLTGGTNYSVRQAGQFIFSKIDFLNGAFGIIPNELDGFLSSSDIPAFFFNNKIIPIFLQYWLSENYKKLKIERTGTSNTLKRISTDSFFSITLAIPSLPEQQKIATCLSSLDELISAHNKKLDALKKHKKGLMQQLFPAEGQTVPTLRFPEFSEAGEWDVKHLGEICNTFLNGGTPSTQKTEFWQGRIPWITGADVVNQKVTNIRRFITEEAVENSSTNIVKRDNLLIVTRTGVGKIAIAPFDLAISQDLTGIYVNKEQSSTEYLYEFLNSNSDKIKSMNQGTSIAGITRESLIEIKISLPSLPEQQKIAACLSSLDELITAHSQKLAALKKHKKGLMQQLFPVAGAE